MNKLLKDLYDCFCTPPELAATKREIEECHRALIEACLLYTSDAADYDDERPVRCQAAEKPGARFTLKKEDDEQ